MKNFYYFKNVKTLILSLMFVSLIFVGTQLNTAFAEPTWANKQIAEWKEKGMISEKAKGFQKPYEDITRAEFMSLVNRMNGYTTKSAKVKKYTDVKESDWFYDEVAIALEENYISGVSDNQISPNGFLTREQAMAIISKISGKKTDHSSYQKANDFADVSTWARDGVSTCIKEGFISGNDGKINPKGKLSRAAAIVILNRLLTDDRAFTLKGEYNLDGQLVNSITVNSNDITVVSAKTKEDLTISASCLGNVTLDNITVNKKMFVHGAPNGVTLNNSKVKSKLELVNPNGDSTVITKGKTQIESTKFKNGAKVINNTDNPKSFGKLVISNDMPQSQKASFEGTFSAVTNNLDKANMYVDGEINLIQLNKNLTVSGNVKIKNINTLKNVEMSAVDAKGKTLVVYPETKALVLNENEFEQFTQGL